MTDDLVTVNTTVNGTRHERAVEARMLLSDFIRHELGLTGTHVGCEHGVCGACTILVDGLPVRACLLFAPQANGCTLETVESLSTDPSTSTRCRKRSATPTDCNAASARRAS